MKKLKVILLLSITLVISFFRIYNYNYEEILEKKTVGIVTNIKTGTCNSFELKADKKILVYDCNHKYKYGDKVLVYGKLERPKSSITFDYEKYLKSKNIEYVIYSDKTKLIDHSNNIFYILKNHLNEKIKDYKSKKYLKAFILGKTDEIDEEILESYRANGISHLLAISGMHITILSFILFSILNLFIKRRKTCNIIISLFLILYIFITSFAPSVIRASLMFILLTYNHKKIKSIDILILIFCAMLLYNPFYLYNIGFCFSFIVTFFLILSKDKIRSYNNYFIKTLIISFISFLASMPILIMNFYEINLLTPFLNLIFIPIVSFIIYPLSLLTFVFNSFDNLFYECILKMEELSLFFIKFDMFNIILKDINVIVMVLYYILIYYTLMDFKKIIIFLFILIIHHNINYFDRNAYITMIDVGQGDSIFLKLPYNRGNILIDTGGNYQSEGEIAKNKIIPFLKKEGINNLDYLILTHGDLDHAGETLTLIKNFKIDKIIMNKNNNELEDKISKAFKNVLNVSKYELKINNYNFLFLNKTFENENDSSLIIYTKINKKNILLMGDATKASEQYILDEYNLPKMDILKVGHHGSKTSSSSKFLKKIKPKICLISAGVNNRYGHPAKEVVSRLKKYGKVYNTATNGTVKIYLTAR